jgi:hypothetical protein
MDDENTDRAQLAELSAPGTPGDPSEAEQLRARVDELERLFGKLSREVARLRRTR